MMLPDRPRLQVLVGGRDVTERCDSLTFSSIDRGGYEIATFAVPGADRPRKGDPVLIRSGLEIAWMGRVSEVADHSQRGTAQASVGCEGLQAVLRDNEMTMIYIDRDLTRWTGWSTARQIALINAGNDTQAMSWALTPDSTSGLPALAFTTSSAPAGVPVISEAWYDASANHVARLRVAKIVEQQTPSLHAFSATDNIDTGELASTDYGAANATSIDWTPSKPQRFCGLRMSAGGSADSATGPTWAGSGVSVIGDHGLPLRGSGGLQDGYWPSDIVHHVIGQISGVVPGNLVDASSFLAPHVVYPSPTAHAQIIDDMAKLMGWHWGMWEPFGILGAAPRLDFCPPPSDATCVVSKADCDQLDVTQSLADMYDVAEISYSDMAGIAGTVSVTLPNPGLAAAGIAQRTLQLNMGAGDAVSAATFGYFALALSQDAARAAGQATVPSAVRLRAGGSKPAELIRPGLDRLRILDLSDGGALLDTGNVRPDVFRISRAETTVAQDGSFSTRLELDNGTNLFETLQARTALAQGVVGSGASG